MPTLMLPRTMKVMPPKHFYRLSLDALRQKDFSNAKLEFWIISHLG